MYRKFSDCSDENNSTEKRLKSDLKSDPNRIRRILGLPGFGGDFVWKRKTFVLDFHFQSLS
ncbi:hypothetical protein DLM78_22710 [Leptospira stimsonii]|uniref:Uncharacterized protein n=1 Tax=Leptospira stimsonii TaxID=2202203 RepID=A0A8B3CKI9_9LEPT|nr:hypothetical protein DLM78_22710 [Leptospira stimsonii]